MNMSTEPLLARTYWSLGLTPAQSWIAEARRSRDLLAGSRLLAWGMGRLLVFLGSRHATVKLPEVTAEDLESLAGRFATALEEGSSGVSNHASGWVDLPLTEAEGLFHELQAEWDSLWSELRADVAVDAGRSAKDLWRVVDPAIGAPSCPLQLVWALRESASEPQEGLDQVEAVFAAVKRSRPVPRHSGFPVRKCGQCGRREAMGGETPEEWREFQDRLSKVPEVRQGLRIDAAEYLCPVCALRRFAGYLMKRPFPSTSEIAASEWLWRIRNAQDLCAALTALEKAMEAVYEEKWADRAPLYYQRSLERELRRARKDGDEDAEKKLTEVQAARRGLEKAIRELHGPDSKDPIPEKPPEYLAVLTFDGDEIGRKLRENLDTLPGQVVEFQRRLTAWFRTGESVPPRGQPFYLGGDEGLILAPVAEALNVARGIKKIWDATVGEEATLSMGIALFDRERPLGAAIEAARRSLERAKGMDPPNKKNALAVSVQTASGSEWTAVAHWGESWDRIQAAVELIRDRTLASGWPYDVERFLRTLSKDAFESGGETRAALREEVKRITLRRCFKEEDRKTIWEKLQGETWWKEQPADQEVATLPDHLHLVAFLAREAGAR